MFGRRLPLCFDIVEVALWITYITGILKWSVAWVGLTVILVIPQSARFCPGRWGFGRMAG